mmetsp:Transcript_15202/g.47255  ORF Transcript_15202/g.47255 Transcript_15202/m.47255 type:complete len:211 (-) Transcript_15202:1554-2186(-)
MASATVRSPSALPPAAAGSDPRNEARPSLAESTASSSAEIRLRRTGALPPNTKAATSASRSATSSMASSRTMRCSSVTCGRPSIRSSSVALGDSAALAIIEAYVRPCDDSEAPAPAARLVVSVRRRSCSSTQRLLEAMSAISSNMRGTLRLSACAENDSATSQLSGSCVLLTTLTSAPMPPVESLIASESSAGPRVCVPTSSSQPANRST